MRTKLMHLYGSTQQLSKSIAGLHNTNLNRLPSTRLTVIFQDIIKTLHNNVWRVLSAAPHAMAIDMCRKAHQRLP